jgi:hypothetical protein
LKIDSEKSSLLFTEKENLFHSNSAASSKDLLQKNMELNPLNNSAIITPLDSHHQVSQRTQILARKVAEVKSQKLTCIEWIFSKGLGNLFALPSLGTFALMYVPVSTSVAIFRFGKVDRVISKPGLYYVPFFYDSVSTFTGTQTQRMDELNLVDSTGNPIVVRALLEYAVDDAAALKIATDNSLTVLFNQAEQVVREACLKHPLLGEKGHDLRSLTNELGAHMMASLQPDASVMGVTVQRLVIVEARYDPSIASQMLMKQQAQAVIGARKEIVDGALGVVREVLQEFPHMSENGRERIINNLLVTLTDQPNVSSHNSS